MKLLISTSAILGTDKYTWYAYKGDVFSLKSAKGSLAVFAKGTVFGLRPSSDGKKIRLVQEAALTKVFTITPEVQTKLVAKSKVVKGDKFKHEEEEEVLDIDHVGMGKKALAKHLKTVRPEFAFDSGIVGWLRGFLPCGKLNDKNEAKALVSAQNAAAAKIVHKKVKAGKNAESIAAANLLLKKSVPKLYADAIEYATSGFDMLAMSMGDCADHLELACALYAGDLKTAERLSNMDTASREEIPSASWDYLSTMLVPRITVLTLKTVPAPVAAEVKAWANSIHQTTDIEVHINSNWAQMYDEYIFSEKEMLKFDKCLSFLVTTGSLSIKVPLKLLSDRLPRGWTAESITVQGNKFIVVKKG